MQNTEIFSKFKPVNYPLNNAVFFVRMEKRSEMSDYV